jgi:hypothetical protein
MSNRKILSIIPFMQRGSTLTLKYPLWKYVTREDGPSNKGKGGGNVQWKCNFCHNTFKSTYYRVKGHLLALPGCGIGACTSCSFTKEERNGKRVQCWYGKCGCKIKKTKNEDPLPFLRKGTTKFPFESSTWGTSSKKKGNFTWSNGQDFSKRETGRA